MKNSLNRLIAGIACTVLIAGLSVPAHAAEVQPEAYTIQTAQWSREDFSQDANPDVFTATYDRALYNAIRQTLVDGTSDTAPAYTMVGDSEYSAVKNLLARMEGVVRYEHHVPENFTNYWQYLDYFAVSAAMPENYQAPFDFIQPIIAEAAELDTDSEKVEYLNDYLCTLLAYKKGKTAGVTRTFTQHSGELQAACGSYARAFKFLCGAAGIPCFTISTSNHTWNMVYADGQWLHVDVSANDLYHRPYILLTETVEGRTDRAPEQTAFLKELFVPGSTK
nr:transglutaminase domain-containing protein [uncultured Oscillibacter sp.]